MTDLDTKRKPPWLKVRHLGGPRFEKTSSVLKAHGLATICQAANCPNRGECFSRGTATFLILGPRCSRNCGFCDVLPGLPAEVDPNEPRRIAETSAKLELSYVVVTSVTRDDLPDGGAGQFVKTINCLREILPSVRVEILTPDFRGVLENQDLVLKAGADVFNHNLETVPRLYAEVRSGASYARSLALLERAATVHQATTKSGLILGLGETTDELQSVFDDLARVGVSILTMGQYLQPSRQHLPVIRYLPPEEFDHLAQLAREAGIPKVLAGPLVRSSYLADQVHR